MPEFAQMNTASVPTLTFVGEEIAYLERLIDETPTKYGKHLLNLLSAVRKKREMELRIAQEQYHQQQMQLTREFNKRSRAPRKSKVTKDSIAENTDARV